MNRFRVFCRIPALLLLLIPAHAQTQWQSKSITSGQMGTFLQDLVNRAAITALEKFADKKLTQEQLSITLINLSDPQHPSMASFRGNERVYPATVVELFYVVA